MLIRNLARKRQRANNQLYVDDVFSTFLYTGNGSTQTINNGIDLAGEGGLVWCKCRNDAFQSFLTDTMRGNNFSLVSSELDADFNYGALSGFNSDGFSLTSSVACNRDTYNFVSWAFRKAPKFFSLSTVTKSSGSDATVSFTDLETLGMVIVKRTNSTGSWYTWHRSLTAGKLLYLNTTAAEATLGHITVSGTTVTLENGVIADGNYIVYAYAHDTSEDGLIQCGSCTTDGSGNATVNLGWEPQYLIAKRTTAVQNWLISDNMRGMSIGATTSSQIFPNTSDTEYTSWSGEPFHPSATGFKTNIGSGGFSTAVHTYIYLAIRRPNKPPTSGTQVYNAIARTGTGAVATVTGVGFSPDCVLTKERTGALVYQSCIFDRVRGGKQSLQTTTTNSEWALSTSAFGNIMDGISVGNDDENNKNTYTYINHFFRRAVGFMDIVCYTGTGVARTVNHNLGVVPELMIVKCRSANGYMWIVGSIFLGSDTDNFILLNAPNSKSTLTNFFITPTTTTFGFGSAAPSDSSINQSGQTYVSYLFASLDGISKIGSYTGNGSTLNIDCGFSAGARFVLIKATSTTGNWIVGDSTRGIVAGNDPYLLLNSTAAEVTNEDWLDPYAAGFTVNETTAHANVNGTTYIYLAIS